MATGDQADMARRLRGLLPNGWFPHGPGPGETEQAPVLAGMLAGMASTLSAAFTLLGAVARTTRLATMSGPFIDAFAADYFGTNGLPRMAGEADSAYAARIRASLVGTRNTRAALSAAVQGLTGDAPILIEPMNAHDCHAYGASGTPGAGGGYGYGCAGLHRGTLTGGQVFVMPGGNPNNVSAGAVYAAIVAAKAEGVIAWVQAPVEETFILGHTMMGTGELS